MRSLDADHERERAVLGGILLYGSDALDVAECEARDFDHPGNRVVFEAFRRIDERGQRIDAVELIAELDRSGVLKVAGGVEAVHALGDQFRGATNLRQHAARLRRLTEARILREGLRDIASLEDSDEMIEAAQSRVHDLLDARDDGPAPIGEVVDRADARTAAAALGQQIVIDTGFRELNRPLDGGFYPGDVIVVGARPSMGKTAFMVSVLGHSVRGLTPAYIASLEMDAEQLVQRLQAFLTLIPFKDIRTGNLSETQSAKLRRVSEQIKAAPIVIDDRVRTLGQLRSRVRRWRRRQGEYAWAAVDYLQLLYLDAESQGSKITNREQEVAALSRGLKGIARDLKIPMMVLCQLNRALETRGEKRPTLADLRESGAIEQDADVVLFPHREEKYNPTPQNKGLAEIGIGKQRNGELGRVELYFKDDLMGFFPRWRDKEAA